MTTIATIFIVLPLTVHAFAIYWNAPSRNCQKKWSPFSPNLAKYGIKSNKDQRFVGDTVVIFYEKQLGLYPYFEKGVAYNGGIPQKVNLYKHANKVLQSLAKYMPDPNYRGLAILNWEQWFPTWELNFSKRKIYRKASINYTKTRNPRVPPEKIENLAKRQFEFAAKIRWLYRASTALYPSIYIRNWLEDHSQEEKNKFIIARLVETRKYSRRMRGTRSSIPIYPYTTFAYGHYSKKLQFYTKADICASLRFSADQGTAGVVLWGSSRMFQSEDKCKNITKYIDDHLGPSSELLLREKAKCARKVCSSHGECVQQSAAQCSISQAYKNPTCMCKNNWKGKDCSKINGNDMWWGIVNMNPYKP